MWISCSWLGPGTHLRRWGSPNESNAFLLTHSLLKVSLSLGCAGTSWWRAWYKEYQKHGLPLYKQDPRKELKIRSNNKRAGFQMGFSSRLSSIYLLLATSTSSAFCPLNAYACSLNSYILMFENLNQRYRIIINKIKMFNPQRKSKVSDIFMQ